MNYTFRTWKNDNYYNFNIEFNRIESYNEYCKEWLSYYGINVTFTSKNNWNIYDVIDIKDYNRVKTNINILINAIGSNTNNLNISTQYNQVWNVDKANELEKRLKEYLKFLGEYQFAYNITGLSLSGNNLKLNGVM